MITLLAGKKGKNETSIHGWIYSPVLNSSTGTTINFGKILIKCYEVNSLCSVMYSPYLLFHPYLLFSTGEYVTDETP